MARIPQLESSKTSHQCLMLEWARADWRPPSNLPVWRWCEENVELDSTGPMPGRYSTAVTPMARWVFEAARDRRVRRVVVMVSAQSSKSLIGILFLLWTIAEDPGPCMWVMANQDHCEEFAKKRLFPAVESCALTAPLLPKERNARNKRLIQFHSMNLMMRGSNSRAGLQSDPVRRVFCDERREWKHGAINLLRKRLRTYHNSIEISLGTAGREGDELHSDWLEGSRTEAHWRCPACQHSQPFRFSTRETILFPTKLTRGGLVWPTNAVTKPEGRWNYEEVAKATRMECAGCGAQFPNTEKFRLIQSMHPVDYNLDAPRSIRSFHWNALAMPWVSCDWGELAVEFLKALAQARRGNIEPLVAFVTETLGEPWEEAMFFPQDAAAITLADYTTAGVDPAPGKFWDREHTRFMAVDVQLDHFWFVTRAFAGDGTSRLVACGRLDTFADVRQMQLELRVEDTRTVLDRRYRSDEVDEHCALFGWQGMIGDNKRRDGFPRYDAATRRKIVLPYSTWTYSKPFVFERDREKVVRRGRWFSWAGKPIKDRLQRLFTGRGLYWGFPDDVSQKWRDQMGGERLKQKTLPNGKIVHEWVEVGRAGTHLRDCECMVLVCAIADRLMDGEGLMREAEKPEPKVEAETSG